MNDTSLKAKIRNFAKEKNISAQAVLQHYLMTHFLYRLSLSEYKEMFVVKGGVLISSMVGIAHRSTMDLDTTLRNLPLSEQSISKAMKEISAINGNDDIVFSFDSISPIRHDDVYGGIRVSFSAKFGKINAPMSMDITTGDIITPSAVKHTFTDMFNNDMFFELWSYPIETVLAEKIEAILSRNISNTRLRDFYDVYMLTNFNYNPNNFKNAIEKTSQKRGSRKALDNYKNILELIKNDDNMNHKWIVYAKEMPYANGISFDDTILAAKKLLDLLIG